MRSKFPRFSPEWWEWMTMPEPNSGCLLWTGSVCKEGYGRIGRSATGSPVLAHRIAYECAFGRFDRSLRVLHRCDTPSCVNPDHLLLGTQKDNMRDMFAKGRGRPAGRVPGAFDQRIIALRLGNPPMTTRQIAAALGTTQHTVSRVLVLNGMGVGRGGFRRLLSVSAPVAVKELASNDSNERVIMVPTVHHMRSCAVPSSWRHVTGVPAWAKDHDGPSCRIPRLSSVEPSTGASRRLSRVLTVAPICGLGGGR